MPYKYCRRAPKDPVEKLVAKGVAPATAEKIVEKKILAKTEDEIQASRKKLFAGFNKL